MPYLVKSLASHSLFKVWHTLGESHTLKVKKIKIRLNSLAIKKKMPISSIDFLINYFKNLPVRMPYLVKSLASHCLFKVWHTLGESHTLKVKKI